MQIKDRFLNKHFIQATSTVSQPVNYYFIYDRSGSMYWTLPQLITDVKQQIRTLLKEGDTITVAWFSGEGGQYEYVLIGHEIHETSLDKIDAILDKNSTTVGLTCFSEVLLKLVDIMPNLDTFSRTNILTLFTDGCPVVRNRAKEEQAIFDALDLLNPMLDSSLMVGYGGWYNKELMLKMAVAANGRLVHADDLSTFRRESTIELSGAEPATAIPLEYATQAFLIHEQKVRSLPIVNGRVTVPRSAKEIYYVSERDLDGDVPNMALYALAYIQMQQGKRWDALETLGVLGDKHLIDMVNRVYTLSELGEAEEALREAVFFASARHKAGEPVANYIPAPDEFCMLDLLNLLVKDSKSMFYPDHEAWSYKRIGPPKKTKDGYPTFQAIEGQGIPFESLVWNSSRANVSVRAFFKGGVEIGANDVGLHTTVAATKIQTYTIIRDGVLNVTKLPITTTRGTFRTLKQLGLVEGRWKKDEIYVIDMTSLPMINREIAEDMNLSMFTSALESELYWQARQKAVNYFYDKLNPSKIQLDSPLTAEQQLFLQEKGIRNGVFSPPQEAQDTTDVYLAKELVTKIKGFSSLPSVDKVMSKGGVLTPSETLMRRAIDEYSGLSLLVLEKEREIVKTALREARENIYRIIFSAIVGGSWFDGISKTDTIPFMVDGINTSLSFDFREIEVKI